MTTSPRLLAAADFDRYADMVELELRNRSEASVSAPRPVWYALLAAAIAGMEQQQTHIDDVPELRALVGQISERVFGYDAGCRHMLAHMRAVALARLQAGPPPAQPATDIWFPTYSGILAYPYAPDCTFIVIEDIAHGLANVCAHAGHTGWFYSRAQHALLLSKLCAAEFALEALLHDALRAYIPELPNPGQKQAWLSTHSLAEADWRAAIAKEFGLLHPAPPELETLHAGLERWELRELFETLPTQLRKYGCGPEHTTMPKITALLPEDAEQEFLAEFQRLSELRQGEAIEAAEVTAGSPPEGEKA